jgi:iron complex outermembrane receptor protein
MYSNIAANCGELAIDELVAHAATQRLEIGNPGADIEKSTNIELGLRKHLGNVTGEFNLFYNQIADYIFLFDSGVFSEGTEIARYLQEDAVFTGFESQLSLPLLRTGDHISELTLFSDYVRARFNKSGNVPRIPALRYGAEYKHSHVNWQAILRLSEVTDQSNFGANETSTAGHTLLSLYVDYHLQLPGWTGLLFINGTNLLDENIRHHASLLKDVAPAPGRSWEVGLRFEF